ncbi:unnamed protein product [Owenia fusiformis]|uniref:Immunoglobulin domain-containing protein n=2 Tax=Owenia fusiformis TaxID=6347 RepID=A0A8S4QAI1_OWEFU|nr:unnamed protein product [Owenia fusiformis]
MARWIFTCSLFVALIGVFTSAVNGIVIEITGPDQPKLQGEEIRVTCVASDGFDSNAYFVRFFKKVDGKAVEISTNHVVKEEFGATGRYKTEFSQSADVGTVILTIQDAQNGDDGEIGCQALPGPKEDVPTYTNVKLNVPVNIILKQYAPDADKYRPVDGDTIVLKENVKGGFACVAKDSNSRAEVRAFIGDKDVTDEMKHHLHHDPEQVKLGALIQTTYKSELKMQKSDWDTTLNGDVIRCEAKVPGYETVSAQAVVEMQYAPRFTCKKEQSAKLGSNFELMCEVDMKPAAAVFAKWYWGPPDNRTEVAFTDSTGRFTANVGEADGTKTPFGLSISNVSPEDVNVMYHLEVSNGVAIESQEIMLLQDKSVEPKPEPTEDPEVKEEKPKADETKAASSQVAASLTFVIAMVAASILNH